MKNTSRPSAPPTTDEVPPCQLNPKPDLANLITNTFCQFIRQDVTLLLSLKSHNFTFSSTQWQFTLPKLHQFIRANHTDLTHLPYKQFRKTLTNSPINHQLAKLNAEIIIIDNQKKVDRSTYAVRFDL